MPRAQDRTAILVHAALRGALADASARRDSATDPRERAAATADAVALLDRIAAARAALPAAQRKETAA